VRNDRCRNLLCLPGDPSAMVNTVGGFSEGTLPQRSEHFLDESKLVPLPELPPEEKRFGRDFFQKNHLTYHVRIHSEENVFACEFCPRRFAKKKALILHVSVHTGPKPYECFMCKKQFALKSHLNSHEKAHADQTQLLKTSSWTGNSSLKRPNFSSRQPVPETFTAGQDVFKNANWHGRGRSCHQCKTKCLETTLRQCQVRHTSHALFF